jgi:hypothetical protein
MPTAPALKLVLGMARDMTLAQLRPFFRSLENTGYRGDIALIAHKLPADALEFLAARRVILISFREFRMPAILARLASAATGWLPVAWRDRFEEWLAIACHHENCARHFFYRRFLASFGDRYDQVMLTDVRDVFFQANPFDFEMPDGLCVFWEDSSRRIGLCGHTSLAIRRGFGNQVLAELFEKPVLCAGIIYGSTAAVREHLEKSTAIFRTRKISKTIDQATHNLIIHRQPPPCLRAFANDNGPVLTMSNMRPEQFRFDADGRLVDVAGRVYNVLHQYDRHPELAARLLRVLT